MYSAYYNYRKTKTQTYSNTPKKYAVISGLASVPPASVTQCNLSFEIATKALSVCVECF